MNFLIVAAAYILAHGVTALVVTPVQSIFFPEYTVFASLIYLPHGVRVLATWAFGWRAIPALVLGVTMSAWLFSPTASLEFLEPDLVKGILIGAFSAFLAFELARFVGYDSYFGHMRKVNWKVLIIIGAISSIINSLGQTLAYSGLIGLGNIPGTLVIYAVGDLVGLVVCMVVLMFCFRWVRWFSLSKGQ
ncbi:hypothetical protein [Pseudorhodobacter wandonensis]|uniref:hypothetical protein n=1 Tax=Pseudorhodobacter wandonensis TaxID=1120568 RepID=UPI00067CE031|nr:hypothetical protein [Pseudorhodobacter wandonensis]